MTKRRAFVAVLFAALMIAAPAASPVAAQDCGGSASEHQGGGVQVWGWCEETSPTQPASQSDAPTQAELWAAYCTGEFQEGFSVATPTPQRPATPEEVAEAGYDPNGQYMVYAGACTTPGTIGDQGIFLFVQESTPPVPPEALRDEAAALINPTSPTIGTNPPVVGDRFAIVNLPTWLWVTDPWEPITESNSHGVVTVEVAATPVRVTWRMGDGGVEHCTSAGVVWSEDVHDAGTDCSYTYQRSSAGERGAVYDASASMVYDVEWWINGSYQGVFDTIERTTAFTVPVGEIQVVESAG